MKLKKLTAALSAAAFGLSLAASPMTASAQEIYNFEILMRMADTNKDGMITKDEFMAAMSTAFDGQMEMMKGMPDASKMMKGDAMTSAGLKAFLEDLYTGP